jgi:hypothetical protein
MEVLAVAQEGPATPESTSTALIFLSGKNNITIIKILI